MTCLDALFQRLFNEGRTELSKSSTKCYHFYTLSVFKGLRYALGVMTKDFPKLFVIVRSWVLYSFLLNCLAIENIVSMGKKYCINIEIFLISQPRSKTSCWK